MIIISIIIIIVIVLTGKFPNHLNSCDWIVNGMKIVVANEQKKTHTNGNAKRIESKVIKKTYETKPKNETK